MDYPPAKKAKEKRQEKWTVLVFSVNEEFALEKRKDEGLLASLYQFPLLEGKLSLKEVQDYLKNHGMEEISIEDLGTKEHVFSHLIWDLQGYRILLKEKPPSFSGLWVKKKDLKTTYPIPSAFSYFKKKIL